LSSNDGRDKCKTGRFSVSGAHLCAKWAYLPTDIEHARCGVGAPMASSGTEWVTGARA
jgi:hypothetical protein